MFESNMLRLVYLAGHERSPGVRLEQFMPDEIVAVCAPRIRDPKFRRAIQNLKSARDLELVPLIWRERGAGTRAMVLRNDPVQSRAPGIHDPARDHGRSSGKRSGSSR